MRAHLANDVQELGAVAYYYSSVFESSHTSYKEKKKATSRRLERGVSKTVALIAKKRVYRLHLSENVKTNARKALFYNLISVYGFINSARPMSCRLHGRMTSMRTDQAQCVAISSTQCKASDLEAMLCKVENEAGNLGTNMALKGLKMLHHNSALGQ